MSSINHRDPKAKFPQGLGPLNTRKTDQTVGQTYGERREKAKAIGAEESLYQRVKDRFLGTKKHTHTEEFSNKNDSYLGAQKTHSLNPIVERKDRIENGLSISSKVAKQPGDAYVRFLDSVIQYLDVQKPKKKV